MRPAPAHVAFTFDSPATSGMSIANTPTTAGGQSITISGLNFGPPWKNLTPSARMGDTGGLGHCATASWTSGTTVACAPGYGYGAIVRSI